MGRAEPPPITSYEDLRNRIGEVARRLTLYAWKCGGRREIADAEDAAHDALAEVFDDSDDADDSRERWDPSADPDMFKFLKRLTRRAVDRRRKKARRSVLRPGLEMDEYAGGRMSPEAAVARQEGAVKAIALLRALAEAAGDDECLQVVAALEDGIDGPQRMADATGLPLDVVKAARRRVERLLESVEDVLSREGPAS